MKNRIRELEILRAFAFIFVILQHGLGSAASNIDLAPGVLTTCSTLYCIAETAVATFLFLSGLTSAYTYKEKLDLKKYYKSRFLYLIVPYFIWSFMNMLWYNPERLDNFLLHTIAGNGNFHLWYMGMFIRLVLLMPLIIYVARLINKQHMLIRLGAFISSFIGCYYLSTYQWKVEGFFGKLIFGTPTDVEMRIISISILFWAFYVILGITVGFNYDKFKQYLNKYRYIIYLSFIMLFLYKFQARFELIEFSRIKDILYRTSNIFFFLLLSIKLCSFTKILKIFEFISKYSYVAYLIHIKVLYYFIFGFRALGIDHALWNAIISTLFASLATPYVVFLISLIPKSKILTGVKPNTYIIKDFYTYFKSKYPNDNLLKIDI